MLSSFLNKYTALIIVLGLIFFLGLSVFGYWAVSKDYNFKYQFENKSEKEDNSKEINFSTSTKLLKEPGEVVLLFGGDVMLARHVQTIQTKLNNYTKVWENIADLTKSADIAIINLESPLIDRIPYPSEGFIFRARPENIQGLKFAGVDVVNLANNHFGNAGREGMDYTFKILQDNNIEYIGAGDNIDTAYLGKIIPAKTKKIGFLAQSYNMGFGAGTSQPGVANFDLIKLEQSIVDLKDGTDFIVVQFHGGTEYTHEPNQQQIKFAQAAIDAGADLVIGHHPHWIQRIEKYQGHYIFYSLGNLIFDQNWSRKTSEGLLVKVILSDKTKLELIPVIIQDNFRPRLADEFESQAILNYINITSTLINL